MKLPKHIKKDPIVNNIGFRAGAKETTRKILRNVVFDGVYFNLVKKIEAGETTLGKFEKEKVMPILIDAGYVTKGSTKKLTKLGKSYFNLALAD